MAGEVVSCWHQTPASEAPTVSAMGRQRAGMKGARAPPPEEGLQAEVPGGDGVVDRPRVPSAAGVRGAEEQGGGVPPALAFGGGAAVVSRHQKPTPAGGAEPAVVDGVLDRDP